DGLTGDYRLRYDSPLIDAGDSTPLGSGETDLGGNPRIVDGVQPFGGAVRDIGAYEYQPSIPTAVATPSTGTASPGQAVSFDSAGSSDPENDPISFSWSFDDGATATGATASHAFTTPGVHTATLTVTDATGQTATATANVDVRDTAPPNETVSG